MSSFHIVSFSTYLNLLSPLSLFNPILLFISSLGSASLCARATPSWLYWLTKQCCSLLGPPVYPVPLLCLGGQGSQPTLYWYTDTHLEKFTSPQSMNILMGSLQRHKYRRTLTHNQAVRYPICGEWVLLIGQSTGAELDSWEWTEETEGYDYRTRERLSSRLLYNNCSRSQFWRVGSKYLNLFGCSVLLIDIPPEQFEQKPALCCSCGGQSSS